VKLGSAAPFATAEFPLAKDLKVEDMVADGNKLFVLLNKGEVRELTKQIFINLSTVIGRSQSWCSLARCQKRLIASGWSKLVGSNSLTLVSTDLFVLHTLQIPSNNESIHTLTIDCPIMRILPTVKRQLQFLFCSRAYSVIDVVVVAGDQLHYVTSKSITADQRRQ